MNSHVHSYYPVFSYFANQLGHPLDWWKDKIVLDFGGNSGNVLRDPTCTIRHENYYCLDISLCAIEKGKNDFPDAHWYYYNRFNVSYNFNGNKDEPFPVFDNKFDVILIYSVFTSTSKTEMLRCINDELLPLLSPGGILINTYLNLDIYDYRILLAFLRKRGVEEAGYNKIIEQLVDTKYCYLIGKEIITSEDFLVDYNNQEWILSFYTDEEICNIFPNCRIIPFKINTDGSRTHLVHNSMIIQK